LLLDQLDETRPEQLAQAVMRLADLGLDSSARLDPLVQAGMITPRVKELARATAAAVRDHSSTLPVLRTLADANDTAATKLIDLLIAGGQLDDAQAAALSAYSRFGEPAFLVQAAELMMKLGLDGEAQQAASEGVGQSALDAVSQQAAHWVLAAMAITAAEAAESTVTAMQSWRRAEHHLAECVGAARARGHRPVLGRPADRPRTGDRDLRPGLEPVRHPHPVAGGQTHRRRPGRDGRHRGPEPHAGMVGAPIGRAVGHGGGSNLAMGRFSSLVFATHGITSLGYAAFGFALGVTAGALIRRTVPAMAVTLAIFAAVQIAMPLWIRPSLFPAEHTIIPVSSLQQISLQQGGFNDSSFNLVFPSFPVT
jgi:hypothetical protein